MRLAIVNALLRLPWGQTRDGEGHYEGALFVWDQLPRDPARWRRRLGVWQFHLMTKDMR